MKLFYLIVIVSLSFTAIAQQELTTKFFRDTYKSKVFYGDGSLSDDRLNDLIKILNKDTINAVLPSGEKEIILTLDEKTHIAFEAEKFQKVSQYDYLKNVKGFKYNKKLPHQRGIDEYHYISNPIFFRNNTFCILYEETILLSQGPAFARMGGVGGWNLYKIQDGSWKHALTLSSWMLN